MLLRTRIIVNYVAAVNRIFEGSAAALGRAQARALAEILKLPIGNNPPGRVGQQRLIRANVDVLSKKP